MGFIAMKPFGGGLLNNAELSVKYLSQFENIVPDPGIEKLSEMVEIVRIVESGGTFTREDAEAVEMAKTELGGRWCHRCDDCRPCPQGMGISGGLTVESLIKRMPRARVTAMAERNMETAKNCVSCRACVKKCPYELNIPELLKEKIGVWDEYMRKS